MKGGKGFLDYFYKSELFAEACALWLEHLTLSETDIWDSRLEKIGKIGFNNPFFPDYHSYLDILESAKRYVQKDGSYEFWYSLGFPKMLNSRRLVEISKEKLGHKFKGLLMLIHMGSKKERSDVDLVAVLRDGVKPDYNGALKNIDFVEYNLTDFLSRLRDFEFFATEPLLTGTLVCGDPGLFDNLKSSVSTENCSPGVFLALENKACELKEKSEAYDKAYQSRGNVSDFVNSLHCLSYHISTMLRVEHLKGGRIVNFGDIQDSRLDSVRRKIKSVGG